MKKYICFLFLLGLFACQEEDLVWYSEERDGLQFSASNSVNLTFDFAMATYEDEQGETRYYGDSLKNHVFNKVILELQGFPTPDERPYRLKTVLVEKQDSSKIAEVVFESYYSLAPHALKDTISFTALRPEKRGTYVIGIVVDTAAKDAFFTNGVKEQSILTVELRNTYEEPADWKYRTDYLGEFDEEKYAFMVTYSGAIFNRNNNHMWNETDLYNQELRQALKEFNENASPEEKKTFTFPETTKPVWWDERIDLLGEFSEEKHDFIKRILADEEKDEAGLKNNYKLYYWNLIFRQYAEEEGKTDLQFPRYEQKAPWWVASALGEEWSVEKQEFVILNFFPLADYALNDDTWKFAASVLRMAQDRWNVDNPKDELKYNFGKTEEPEWWKTYQDLFGPWSSVKQDLIVETVLKQNIKNNGAHNVNDLTDNGGNYYWVSILMNPSIIAAVNEYNQQHPDNPIDDYPGAGSAGPIWWSGNEIYLGEYSPEKEDFLKSVIDMYDGYYNEWQNWAAWGLICRYELAAYNAENKDNPLDIEFPSATQWSYWDELPYLGEWSEAKQVFILMSWQIEQGWFPDGWALGAPSEWGSTNDWEKNHAFLTEQYEKNYDNFMKTYADAKPDPFTFPASW